MSQRKRVALEDYPDPRKWFTRYLQLVIRADTPAGIVDQWLEDLEMPSVDWTEQSKADSTKYIALFQAGVIYEPITGLDHYLLGVHYLHLPHPDQPALPYGLFRQAIRLDHLPSAIYLSRESDRRDDLSITIQYAKEIVRIAHAQLVENLEMSEIKLLKKIYCQLGYGPDRVKQAQLQLPFVQEMERS